jgi:hypothetical protein
MTIGTKKVLKRLLFWVILIAAPVTFLSLALFYLNAYLTSDRVTFVFMPVLEYLSDRTVTIGHSDIHIGYNTRLELKDVSFYDADDTVGPGMSVLDAKIDRIFLQLGTFSLFTDALALDSMIIEGMSGSVGSGWRGGIKELRWRTGRTEGTEGGNTLTLQLDRNDIRVRHFIVRDAEFRYENEHIGLSLDIIGYEQELSVDMVSLMNILLVSGTVGGTISDPGTGDTCLVSLSGRMQINFDDGTVFIRNGVLATMNTSHKFTAIAQKEDDVLRMRILFEEEEEYVSQSLLNLPPPLREWVFGRTEGSRIRTELIYGGSG